MTYRFDGASMGQLAYFNLALGYLMAGNHEDGNASLSSQFEQADNVTDVLAALALLADSDHPARNSALEQFYDRWQSEPLRDRQMVLRFRPTSASRASLDDVKRLKATRLSRPTKSNRVVPSSVPSRWEINRLPPQRWRRLPVLGGTGHRTGLFEPANCRLDYSASSADGAAT